MDEPTAGDLCRADAGQSRPATNVCYCQVIIELMQFRLMDGTDADEFLAADRRLQEEFAYHQPGLLRRTTAQSNDGEWVVIDHWQTAADADACSERWAHDAIAQTFMRHIDLSWIRVQRYTTL